MAQYIVFRVLNQKFALSILSTSRIVPLSDITPVPDTAEYVLGVIESEEEVVPVIDLPKRFFEEPYKETELTQVIVVYWNDLEIGVLVDEVVQITEFEDTKIDTKLEKITALEEAKEATPIKSFIKTDDEIILEVAADDLFDMKGSLMIRELIESYH